MRFSVSQVNGAFEGTLSFLPCTNRADNTAERVAEQLFFYRLPGTAGLLEAGGTSATSAQSRRIDYPVSEITCLQSRGSAIAAARCT